MIRLPGGQPLTRFAGLVAAIFLADVLVENAEDMSATWACITGVGATAGGHRPEGLDQTVRNRHQGHD
jgi:hypothetical protein